MKVRSKQAASKPTKAVSIQKRSGNPANRTLTNKKPLAIVGAPNRAPLRKTNTKPNLVKSTGKSPAINRTSISIKIKPSMTEATRPGALTKTISLASPPKQVVKAKESGGVSLQATIKPVKLPSSNKKEVNSKPVALTSEKALINNSITSKGPVKMQTTPKESKNEAITISIQANTSLTNTNTISTAKNTISTPSNATNTQAKPISHKTNANANTKKAITITAKSGMGTAKAVNPLSNKSSKPSGGNSTKASNRGTNKNNNSISLKTNMKPVNLNLESSDLSKTTSKDIGVKKGKVTKHEDIAEIAKNMIGFEEAKEETEVELDVPPIEVKAEIANEPHSEVNLEEEVKKEQEEDMKAIKGNNPQLSEHAPQEKDEAVISLEDNTNEKPHEEVNATQYKEPEIEEVKADQISNHSNPIISRENSKGPINKEENDREQIELYSNQIVDDIFHSILNPIKAQDRIENTRSKQLDHLLSSTEQNETALLHFDQHTKIIPEEKSHLKQPVSIVSIENIISPYQPEEADIDPIPTATSLPLPDPINLLINKYCSNPSPLSFINEAINQINFCRQHPGHFAKIIEESIKLISTDESNRLIYQHPSSSTKIALFKGREAFLATAKVLKSINPLKAIALNESIAIPVDTPELSTKKPNIRKYLEWQTASLAEKYPIASSWMDHIPEPQTAIVMMLVDCCNQKPIARKKSDLLSPVHTQVGISSVKIRKRFVAFYTFMD